MGTHVSYKGWRNGFPFPIRELDELGDPIEVWDGTTLYSGQPSGSASQAVTVVGAGTSRPMGFTLAQFAEFFWRVKSFKLSGSWTSSDDSYGDFEVVIPTVTLPALPKKFLNTGLPSMSLIDDSDGAEEVASEVELITPLTDAAATTAGKRTTAVFVRELRPYVDGLPEWYSGFGTWANDLRTPTSGNCDGNFTLRCEFHDTCKSGDLYYPRLSLDVIAMAVELTTIPTASVAALATYTQEYGPTIAITICGATANGRIGNGAPTWTSPADSGSGSITLEPYEYWPYATSEGDPAWDDEDGTPINGGPGA